MDRPAPFFLRYLKVAEEEDNKMAERWRKDADVILIFVSPSRRCSFCYALIINLIDDRPVYSLQLSLRFLR